MSKKDKIFVRWVTILVPLATLCAFIGGITICFNKLVGLILSGIGVGGMFLIMISYITYCIDGLIKLMKEEE
jgi:hypothetical protein